MVPAVTIHRTHDPAGGREESTAGAAGAVCGPIRLLDGLTLSGGAPMAQRRGKRRAGRGCARAGRQCLGLHGLALMRRLVQEVQTRRACGCWRLRGGSWMGPLGRGGSAPLERPLARKAQNQRLIDLNATPQNREAHPANGLKKLLQHNRCSRFYLVRDLRKALIIFRDPHFKCPVAVAEGWARVRPVARGCARPMDRSAGADHEVPHAPNFFFVGLVDALGTALVVRVVLKNVLIVFGKALRRRPMAGGVPRRNSEDVVEQQAGNSGSGEL